MRLERKTFRRKNGKRRTVYKKVARLTQSVAAGKNSLFFSGLVTSKRKQRALSPGNYRVVASAVDLAGNASKKSKSPKKSFTVLAP